MWFDLDGWLAGPIGPGGDLSSEFIETRSNLDFLTGHKGVYGENAVQNVQLNAELSLIPIMEDIVASPITGFPDQIKWYCHTYPSGSNTWRTFKMGRATPGVAFFSSDTMYYYHYIFVGTVGGTFSMYKLAARKSNPYYVDTLLRYDYTYGSIGSNYVRFNYKSWSYTEGRGLGTMNWSSRSDPGTIMSAFHGNVVASINGYRQWLLFIGANQYSYSQQFYTGVAERLAKDLLIKEVFPVEEKPYGDLAMEASAQVNANSVNMLEFLRDLRHPTELIPKLKNMKLLKLKNISKNLSRMYLTVKYGWLPTISDLKNIVGAFRKAKPYLDKNGFKTYTSSFTGSNKIGQVTFELEQHLKLAIADEDNQFQALAQRLDSSGFAPTLENIWDLIPMSFVVDWFIDVGGFLERVDTRLRIAMLNIRYATMSRKQTASTSLTATIQAPFDGSIELVHYHRWVSDQCPVPASSAQLTFLGFDHWIEAGALIKSRS
jgi:hypothetical protein